MIFLEKADTEDAEAIHRLQVESFQPLLERYQDYDTSPAHEGVDRSRGRISPMFILPQFQGKGFGQQAIALLEELTNAETWELDTILQEERNCHLYEKMGYRRTGPTKAVNENMTIVHYEK